MKANVDTLERLVEIHARLASTAKDSIIVSNNYGGAPAREATDEVAKLIKSCAMALLAQPVETP